MYGRTNFFLKEFAVELMFVGVFSLLTNVAYVADGSDGSSYGLGTIRMATERYLEGETFRYLIFFINILKFKIEKVLETPFRWQGFLEKNILRKNPDDRRVDWIIDPVGNTGKSSFARAYISKEVTDGIFMKIDNLDRMELSLIKKIESYCSKYSKDPKVLLFDFPRASDISKVLAATGLMEDAKCGYLESTFGGTHKEIQIGDIHVIVFSNSCPDLSVLSVDRWRLWTLSGADCGNIIWPVKINSLIKKVNTRNWNIAWIIGLTCLEPMEIKHSNQFNTIELNYDWHGLKSKYDSREHFGFKKQYVKDIVTNINYSSNFIKI